MKLAYTIIFTLTLFLTQKDEFTFVNEKQKITLKIDDGKRNLKWGVKSILKLKTENINIEKMNTSAPGIRPIKSENKKNEFCLEIIPSKETIDNDTLKLFVGYKDENNKYISHKFSILIQD